MPCMNETSGRLAINLKISVPDSSHASAPWLSKNAIEESIIFVKELKEKLEANQDGKTKSMLLTATITEIKGGTSHNITPKECETLFDIRIPVDMNCKTIEQKIATLVKEQGALTRRSKKSPPTFWSDELMHPETPSPPKRRQCAASPFAPFAMPNPTPPPSVFGLGISPGTVLVSPGRNRVSSPQTIAIK